MMTEAERLELNVRQERLREAARAARAYTQNTFISRPSEDFERWLDVTYPLVKPQVRREVTISRGALNIHVRLAPDGATLEFRQGAGLWSRGKYTQAEYAAMYDLFVNPYEAS